MIHTCLITTLRRQSQADISEFKPSLVYTANKLEDSQVYVK